METQGRRRASWFRNRPPCNSLTVTQCTTRHIITDIIYIHHPNILDFQQYKCLDSYNTLYDRTFQTSWFLPRMHLLPDTEQLRGVAGHEWPKLDLEPRYQTTDPRLV